MWERSCDPKILNACCSGQACDTPGMGQGDAGSPRKEHGSTQGKVTFVGVRAINMVKNFKVIIRYWDVSTKLDNCN